MNEIKAYDIAAVNALGISMGSMGIWAATEDAAVAEFKTRNPRLRIVKVRRAPELDGMQARG